MAGDVVTGRAGFDPGGRGAVALLDDEGRLLEVHDMPYVDGHVLAPQLAAVVSVGGVTHALVERAQSMPGQGVASVFRYGTGYGVILGVLGALQVSSELVSPARSEEHTSELQSLMRISYAVFCLKKKI